MTLTFSKKSLWISALLGAAVLSGCQSQSNTITLINPAPTSSFNVQNQTAMVNVLTQDHRPSMEVAGYTSAGNVQRLTAVPEVGQLLQQAMQQNLNSKGFMVVQGAGNANVVVNIRKFFANVEQGNLRYKITADINVEVLVQGVKGNFAKNFNVSRSYEGAFAADNSKISNVLNKAYTELVQSLYNDNEISHAIHQYK